MTARFLPLIASRLTELSGIPSDATILCARADMGVTTLTPSSSLPDMVAGLRAWRRALNPGRSIAFSSLGINAFQPLANLYEARLSGYGVKRAGPTARASREPLMDPEMCHDVLREAGFGSIEVRVEQLGYHLHSADEWWDIAWNSSIRDLAAQLTSAQLAQFKSGHLAEISALATPSGIWLDVPAIFAVGRIPARHSIDMPE